MKLKFNSIEKQYAALNKIKIDRLDNQPLVRISNINTFFHVLLKKSFKPQSIRRRNKIGEASESQH